MFADQQAALAIEREAVETGSSIGAGSGPRVAARPHEQPQAVPPVPSVDRVGLDVGEQQAVVASVPPALSQCGPSTTPKSASTSAEISAGIRSSKGGLGARRGSGWRGSWRLSVFQITSGSGKAFETPLDGRCQHGQALGEPQQSRLSSPAHDRSACNVRTRHRGGLQTLPRISK